MSERMEAIERKWKNSGQLEEIRHDSDSECHLEINTLNKHTHTNLHKLSHIYNMSKNMSHPCLCTVLLSGAVFHRGKSLMKGNLNAKVQ